MTSINLSPLLGDLVNVLAMVLLTVGTWAVNRLAHKLKLDGAASQLDSLLTAAVDYAKAALIQTVGHADFTHVDTHNAAVAAAYNFIVANAPTALKTMGISEQSLQQMISGRLARLDPTIVAPAQPKPAPAAPTNPAPAPAAG